MDGDEDIGITKAAPDLLKRLDEELDKCWRDGLTEMGVVKVRQLIDPFQDSPQLLDTRLASIMQGLTDNFVKTRQDWPCDLIYILCKVRGAKVVSRFMPSDASLVDEVLTDLVTSGTGKWERRYVLLLWLSILILIPFKLGTFGEQFDNKVYDAVVPYLSVPGKERDAAALVMARLATRADTKQQILPRVFDHFQSCGTLFGKIGSLQATAIIWRIASPIEVEPFAAKFVDQLQQIEGSSILCEKLKAKNLGRVALCQLNLAENEIPESVEITLSSLLEFLGHQESTVRYTTSKAIARLVAKLDQEMSDDVIDAVLEVFTENVIIIKGVESLDRVDSQKWHGALLCIAEILRRHMLHESKLPQLVSILQKALLFEQKRLTAALGANVRDASCYVCWSLFRVYKNVAVETMSTLLNSLVGLCCFDREVNIRRAASAAIQEGIGRQGDPVSIANGLELIQLVDYFNVGRRSRAYLEVSKQCYDLGYRFVAQTALARIDSWDSTVRRLSSQALAILHEEDTMIPQLLAMYNKRDFEMQHGVLLALGELVSINPTHVSECISILEGMTDTELQDENELLNSEGFLHLFSALASNYETLQAEEKQRVVGIFDKLYKAMDNESEVIVNDAAKLGQNLTQLEPDHQQSVCTHWINEMRRNKLVFTQALGHVTDPAARAALSSVVSSQTTAALTRKHALASLCTIMARQGGSSTAEYEALMQCLDDYTIDTRGDVGSWVRKVAITNSVALFDKASPYIQTGIVNRLLRISGEVLDQMRVQAIGALLAVGPEHIRDELSAHLPIIEDRTNPRLYFHAVVRLLDVCTDIELDYFVSGLVCSCGAVNASTETLVCSLEMLVRHMASASTDHQTKLLKLLLKLVDIKKYGAKLTVSALRTWAGIFQTGYEAPEALQADGKFHKLLHAKTYNAHINTKNSVRINAAIQVFAALAQSGYKPSLRQLVKQCQNSLYPVRTHAAEALYEVVSALPDNDEALEVLAEIDWELDPSKLPISDLCNALNLE